MNRISGLLSRTRYRLATLFFFGVASLLLVHYYGTKAFPEYSIDFSIDRSSAQQQAIGLAERLNLNPDHFQRATVFDVDEQAKTFLEQQRGTKETADIAAGQVPIWGFKTRFFQPGTVEEYTLGFHPDGRFVDLERVISEDAPGVQLSGEEARLVAEKFLLDQAGVTLDQWELKSSNVTKQPNRIDHEFVWERKAFDSAGATIRMRMIVLGNEVGTWQQYLNVPEDWIRFYEQDRSRNDLAQVVAEVSMYLIFGLPLLICFGIFLRKRQLWFRVGLWPAIGTGSVTLAASLSGFSQLIYYSYPTTDSWAAFIAASLLGSIVQAISVSLAVFLVIVVGESLYRQYAPQAKALIPLFTQRALFRTECAWQMVWASVLGIGLIGYQVVFYLAGKQIGFWTPAELNYSDAQSAYFPWVIPLYVGLSAAIIEEGIFRLFGITLLRKYLKRTWIAVVITSLVWGFMHSAYPQTPWFARGIEISLMGILFGILMIRFGVLPSMVAHFTFNALGQSLSYVGTTPWYVAASGVLVGLLPFFMGVITLMISKWRGTSDAATITNEQWVMEPNEQTYRLPDAPKPPAGYHAYQALSPFQVRGLIVLSVLVVILAAVFFPDTRLRESFSSIGRNDALSIAQKTVQAQEIATEQFHTVTTYEPTDVDLEKAYLADTTDEGTLRSIFPKRIPTQLWKVRFFQPLSAEEHIVYLLPSGSVYAVDHQWPESAPGAAYSAEQAQQTVEQYLQETKQVALNNVQLVEVQQDRKPNRNDYYFTYQLKDQSIQGAEIRMDINLLGDHVSGFSEYVNIPESWIREQQRETLFDIAQGALVLITLMVIGFLGVRGYLQLVKRGALPLRLSYRIAGGMVACFIIVFLNSLPTILSDYATTVPLVRHVMMQVLVQVAVWGGGFFIIFLVASYFFALWHEEIGLLLPPAGASRWVYARDAVVSGSSMVALLAMALTVSQRIAQHTNQFFQPSSTDIAPLDTLLPALDALSMLLVGGLLLMFLTTAGMIIVRWLGSWKRAFVFFLLISVLMVLIGSTSYQEGMDMLIGLAILTLTVAGMVHWVGRNNLGAYGVAVWVGAFGSSGGLLLEQNTLFYKINGAVLLAVAFAPIIGYAVCRLLKSSHDTRSRKHEP